MDEQSKILTTYKKIFKNENFDKVNQNGYVQVFCPFHNDNEKSAGIKLDNGFFNCFTCNISLKDPINFLARFHNTNYYIARDMYNLLEENDTLQDSLKDNKEISILKEKEIENISNILRISKETIKKMKMFSTRWENELFSLPIEINGVCLDVRTYFPNQKPKWKGAIGSLIGLIFNFENWNKNKKDFTLICAGEKDALVAIDKGFNAISITGGEQALPKMFGGHFKDRQIVIMYDNDFAGKNGSIHLAKFLQKYKPKVIKNITNHYKWMKEKEDLWDFFNVYNKTKEDLYQIIADTKPFNINDYVEQVEKENKYITIHDALHLDDVEGKLFTSSITVDYRSVTSFRIPHTIQLKGKIDNVEEVLNTFIIQESNYGDLLYLTENDNKKNIEEKKLIKYNYYSKQYKNKLTDPLWIERYNKKPLFQATVIDNVFNSKDEYNQQPLEVFSFKQLETGKNYIINYSLHSHPFQKQTTVAIIHSIEKQEDIIDNFQVDDKVKHSLEKFQKQSIDNLIKQFRSYTKQNYLQTLLALVVDLTYHSVLEFYLPNGELERGTLYLTIIGDSRTGKSASCKGASKIYNKGCVINGKNSTSLSLVGGSKKGVGGVWQVSGGIISKNNKGIVIIEEAQGISGDYYSKMTDLKSSGKLRVSRVDNSLILEAKLRIIEIANPKIKDTRNKQITSFSNGVEVIQQLITAPEDIARQDLFLLVSTPKKIRSLNDNSLTLKPFRDIDYQNRINWVWSRKPNQIIISKEIMLLIENYSNELWKKYHTHIQIFGTETTKKFIRIAIAYAALSCSTDNTFQLIIVKQVHVEQTKILFKRLYDNDIFKIRQYVAEERKYEVVTIEGKDWLKQKNNIENTKRFLEKLYNFKNLMTRNDLWNMSGIQDRDVWNKIFNDLDYHSFIRNEDSRGNYSITDKFKNTYKEVINEK